MSPQRSENSVDLELATTADTRTSGMITSPVFTCGTEANGSWSRRNVGKVFLLSQQKNKKAKQTETSDPGLVPQHIWLAARLTSQR